MKLSEYIVTNRKNKNITLFFDIETLQFNEEEGRKKPSNYKNVVYAVGVGFIHEDNVYVEIYPNFKYFFDEITTALSKWKTKPKIRLIAHNTNKYDNHFLRKDIIYYYDLPYLNLFLNNADRESNRLSKKKKDIDKLSKENGLILEKRIKSSNNLELIFYLNGIEFYTVDNFLKTNASIDFLGKKMLSMNLLSKDEIKTDIDYTKYNRDYDMTEEESREYALKVFNTLTDDEITYIRNDIIVLAKSYINYSKIFKGFNYEKVTFTSNILEYYNDNMLTSYQLLKSYGRGKEKVHVKYTDYFIGNDNFYDYLKSFYNGGLNFYNDKYVGVIVEDDIVGIDINSSYPYAMHKFKVPTYLVGYELFSKENKVEVNYNDRYYLYRMTKKSFDREIINRIDSKVVRQMLVKYYSKGKYININSFTLRMLNDIFHVNIRTLSVLSYVEFECVYFNSREKISRMYEVKEKGSSKYELEYNSPYDIKTTERENSEIYSQDEIDSSKVVLNGLYGIPALRSHFNIFRWLQNDELKNFENGYENNERNIVFSVFVTSVALYNLLKPFKNLTSSEIDENFLYCDTDSLYYKKKIHDKIDKKIFHKHHLGKWGVDCDTITKFKVINHKKYAYEWYSDIENKKKISIKCGGIPLESFNKEMSFTEFCNTQFYDGAKIENTKSIFNNDLTISIYPSITELQVGGGYRMFAHDESYDVEIKKMLDDIKKCTGGELDDMLYIESNLGTFSQSDLFPYENEVDNRLTLDYLILKEREVKNFIQS